MKKTVFVLAAMLLHSTLGFCQAEKKDFPVLKGPYLGQKPPGNVPELFAPGIVSTKDFEHSKLEFSKDGTEICWSAQPMDSNDGALSQKIWFAKRDKDQWRRPEIVNIPQVGGRSATFFPLSGEMFFIGSNESNPADRHNMKYDLFKMDKDHRGIKNISDLCPMLAKCWSFSFARNGNLYFDYTDGKNSEGIYFAEFKNGSYTEPQAMDSAINGEEGNVQPFVSPDESFLLFCSFRSGGYGIADLYISFKDKNGKWGKAINMGADINSSMLERFPSLSVDGKYLFFTRNKDEVCDFYWISAEIIEKLRPKE